MSFNSTRVHRVVPGSMVQAGDILKGNGTGFLSIYGQTFPDEDLYYCDHGIPGMLSCANGGPDTNSTQFFVTMVATPQLNGLNVPFGQVTEGRKEKNMLVMKKIESFGSEGGHTSRTVKIQKAGVYDKKKWAQRDKGWIPDGCRMLERPKPKVEAKEEAKEEVKEGQQEDVFSEDETPEDEAQAEEPKSDTPEEESRHDLLADEEAANAMRERIRANMQEVAADLAAV